jgi:hypothetical protein
VTTITDNFTRADGDIGSSSEGWSWTQVVGDTNIVSNAADQITAGATLNRAETDLLWQNHYAQIQGTASSFFLAVCGRFDASAQTYYRLRAHWNTDQVWLEKVVSTAVTILAGPTTTSPTLNGTDTFRLEVDGTTLVGKVNGVQQITVSDSAISTGTRTGFGATASGSSNLDNFEAADIGTPPVVTAATAFYRSDVSPAAWVPTSNPTTMILGQENTWGS